MRGQLIPLAFLTLLIGGVLVGHVFFNLFYGFRYQAQVFGIQLLDTVRNLIEGFKSYLKLSLTYSSHEALREHALLGGSPGAAPWICNGPNPLPVQFSVECLENYTTYYLNEYVNLFNTSLPLKISKKNFTECIYGIDEGGVFAGKYDEGYFWVNGTGTGLAVSGKNFNMYEEIHANTFITKNRYWYLFRNFYEWATTTPFSEDICSIIGCSCSSASGEEPCSSCSDLVKAYAEDALKKLQEKFDNNVSCSMKRLCCKQGIGEPCLEPSPCISWGETSCKKGCKHENCTPPSSSASLSLSSTGEEHQQLLMFSQDANDETDDKKCFCDYWYEGRISTGYVFECVDYKYFVPSSQGPVPLKFDVLAYAFWKKHDACRTINPCSCHEGFKECSECEGLCCEPCYEVK